MALNQILLFTYLLTYLVSQRAYMQHAGNLEHMHIKRLIVIF